MFTSIEVRYYPEAGTAEYKSCGVSQLTSVSTGECALFINGEADAIGTKEEIILMARHRMEQLGR